jgi:hypothetical protein
MDRTKLRAKFAELEQQGRNVLSTRSVTEPSPNVIAMPIDAVDKSMCGEWGNRVIAAIEAGFGKNHEFYARAVQFTKHPWDTGEATKLHALVRSAIACFDDGFLDDKEDAADAVANVERICERFHSIAREIRARHSDRETLSVNDEYDVQDLFRGLLRVFFDDVRPEEWTPSYAGAPARMDFLLKRERLVLETKMARKGLDAKRLGEELLVDIGRYAAHQDCETLICFVYDPHGWIRNPAAIEGDLSKSHGKLKVRVLIRPRL